MIVVVFFSIKNETLVIPFKFYGLSLSANLFLRVVTVPAWFSTGARTPKIWT